MRTTVGRGLVGLAVIATLAVVSPVAHAQTSAGPAYVTRVVDGDTLYAELGGRLEVVRYLGVNTPRIEHPFYGAERYAALAREANRRLVEGKWIRLVFDGEPRDRFGRLRAYVWVGDRFVNALLVHHGYGEVAAASRAGYAEYFRTLQEGAQRDARGIWRDPSAQVYHRPRSTEVDADTGDREERGMTTTGGRVFSAPAPFIPSSSVISPGSTPSSSAGVPAGPAPRSSSGSPSYMPPGSMRK
jgi:micrococcal nuclease